MGSNRKWIAVSFCGFGVLLWILVAKFSSALLDLIGLPDLDAPLIGGRFTVTTLLGMAVAVMATWVALRHERLSALANEVVVELRKVTWPNAQETRAATVVVIITVFIMSFFLGLFDLFWSSLMDFLYPGIKTG